MLIIPSSEFTVNSFLNVKITLFKYNFFFLWARLEDLSTEIKDILENEGVTNKYKNLGILD